MSDHEPDAQAEDQEDLSHRDPESSGGDAEAAASVEEREAVATDDDGMFEEPDDS